MLYLKQEQFFRTAIASKRNEFKRSNRKETDLQPVTAE